MYVGNGRRRIDRKGFYMGKGKGFSLIELLTVIAIIGVLGSILVPAVDKAKDAAKTTICVSRLHQLGLIMKMYVDENDGFMERGVGYSEGAVSWFQCIQKYYTDKNLLLCPLATKTIDEGGTNPHMAWDNTTDLGNYYKGSYGVNLYIAKGEDDPNFWGSPYVKEAMYVPMLFCSQWKDVQPFPSDQPLEYESLIWTPGPYEEMRRPCIKRHIPYYVNVLFMDLSIEKRTIKQLWRLRWSRMWPSDAPLPVWPDWMSDVPEP